jgi:predicted porin
MKKILIVAAVSALAAGSAFAQSSVTLYGRLNVSAERQDTMGVKVYREVNNASRWGVKGTEDLGGGLKAGFQLESGFNVDTGAVTQATFFGRQSEVNLGGAFGMVRLGNFTSEAYYATADYVSMHNHDTGPSSDALYAYIGRNTNKVAYRLPEFVKGLSVEGAVSAGEGAARVVRSYDFAANYAMGPVQLGLGGEKNDQKQQVGVRALVEAGAFTFGGYVQRDKEGYNPVAYSRAYGSRTTLRLSGMYVLGASEFHLNFGKAGSYSKVSNSSAKQFTVAYNYNLSKRTKVYTYYTKVDDSNPFGAGKAGVYGGDFSSIAFGLRHNF